jgi:hypothetical protein
MVAAKALLRNSSILRRIALDAHEAELLAYEVSGVDSYNDVALHG